jgi:opacity protein-like surface antigen
MKHIDDIFKDKLDWAGDKPTSDDLSHFVSLVNRKQIQSKKKYWAMLTLVGIVVVSLFIIKVESEKSQQNQGLEKNSHTDKSQLENEMPNRQNESISSSKNKLWSTTQLGQNDANSIMDDVVGEDLEQNSNDPVKGHAQSVDRKGLIIRGDISYADHQSDVTKQLESDRYNEPVLIHGDVEEYVDENKEDTALVVESFEQISKQPLKVGYVVEVNGAFGKQLNTVNYQELGYGEWSSLETGLNIGYRRNSLLFRTGLQMTTYKSPIDITFNNRNEITLEDFLHHIESTNKYRYLSIPLEVQYHINKGRFGLFTTIGLTSGILLKSRGVALTHDGELLQRIDLSQHESVRNHLFSVEAGAGVKLKMLPSMSLTGSYMFSSSNYPILMSLPSSSINSINNKLVINNFKFGLEYSIPPQDKKDITLK